MKKLMPLISILFLLFGCSNADEVEISIEEIETCLTNTLDQMETDFEILSSEEVEDGRHAISLSENTVMFVEGNKVSMANTITVPKEELLQSFLILIGCSDETLSFGERNLLISELGLRDDELIDHTKVVNKNNIQYTFSGNSDALILQAELK